MQSHILERINALKLLKHTLMGKSYSKEVKYTNLQINDLIDRYSSLGDGYISLCELKTLSTEFIMLELSIERLPNKHKVVIKHSKLSLIEFLLQLIKDVN